MLPTLLTALVLAQQPPPGPPPMATPAAAEGPLVSDNSFLVEEAYNQEAGVVQHISMFQRDKRTGDWTYSFTQEWPAPWDPKHQLSYTVTGVNAGAGAGLGDAEINWRYQVVQNERVAFAPRVSISLPIGDVDKGRGAGATALDVNMPVSISGGTHVTWHLNAGTFVGVTRPEDTDRIALLRAAGSAVLLPYRRVNVLIEVVSNRERLTLGSWATTTTVSPGVRWAYNFSISGGTHVTWHLNAGTFVGLTRPDQTDRIALLRAAGSAVLLPYRRVNILVEVVSNRERLTPGSWATTTTVSPGVRWAYNFSNGLQIVPGVALPVDLARDQDANWGVIGYLSFEHPFGRRP